MTVQGKTGNGAVKSLRVMRKVNPDTNHHRIASTFKQYARQLCPANQQIIWPFDDHRDVRRVGTHRLSKCHCRNQRECRRGRVTRL